MFPPISSQWNTLKHPQTGDEYEVTLSTAQALSDADFESCFRLIETTSSEDYKKSKDGWKPRSKRKEMKLLDMKYFLIKKENQVLGFVSFMPTYEDDYPVIYCYEIHLSSALQRYVILLSLCTKPSTKDTRTGFGTIFMRHLETIALKIPGTEKTMLTVFTRNERGVKFYTKLGYDIYYSPPPKVLRNSTRVEAEYVIMDKAISR
jgi:ribosomal protein S18 acetylase RimI-like enzyme